MYILALVFTCNSLLNAFSVFLCPSLPTYVCLPASLSISSPLLISLFPFSLSFTVFLSLSVSVSLSLFSLSKHHFSIFHTNLLFFYSRSVSHCFLQSLFISQYLFRSVSPSVHLNGFVSLCLFFFHYTLASLYVSFFSVILISLSISFS